MSFIPSLRAVLLLAFLGCFPVSSLRAQSDVNPPKSPDDIVRVSTDLVQTSVMVFDKQSRFVDGLKPEEFELRVNGLPMTLAFIEQVRTGKLETIRKADTAPSSTGSKNETPTPSYRGRTIVFFIDDFHLSADSTQRTRKAILDFIDHQVAIDDQVAIASASGQIGFLQQFTDVAPVLRAAVARIAYRPYTVRDSENIPMTEYTALQIVQGDKYALEYYSSELLKATNWNGGGGLGASKSGPFGGRPESGMTPGISRDTADRMVRERAQRMLKQSAHITNSTLTTLEGVIKTTNQMSGNKVVFFVSDGFYLNDRDTGLGDKLKQLTDAATRAGVVIYTVDARGLVTTTDASSNRADPAGLVSRSNVGEIAVSQDALNALADDTGGRAALNTGDLDSLVKDALQETSNYYLLGWKPTSEEQKTRGYKKIEVKIAGRPDLKVRLPRGFIMSDPADSTVAAKQDQNNGTAKGTEGVLRAALASPSSTSNLKSQLAVGFLDMPNVGPVLTASVQVTTDGLSFGTDGKQAATIDIAAIVLNDQGKQAESFKTRLNVNPLASNSAPGGGNVIYNHKLPLKPGIYQVRVAAVDDKNGRVGSAAQWVEIPDLTANRLTLSSLMLGGQFIGSSQKQSGTGVQQEQVQFSVDRRFARSSHLNFLMFIYNAVRPDNGVRNLEAQIKISRDGKSIVTSSLRKVPFDAASDAARIPYGADIALQTLPAGRYLLQVTVFDRAANATATEQIAFQIE
ncbi:MAG TPA: VWA domain-containing protein [Pyrinomonadaceae bacterium]|nr:VWA domain-containing protein [Pyrinomonadaceae bacterium]